MLVFNQGFWTRDEKLADEIEGAKWEDLVLDGKVLKDLQENLKSFFNNGSLYDDLGVAWKRGVLLVGPPGNGKSQTIKLLVKESRHPCLYVKSTKGSRDVEDEECIMSIFKRARKSAPCLLVLEDLDSLIVDRTRTFFLNEMDGFARNHGILILASSNHPTRIEPAIRRPSRFDVVYLFEPPSFQLRCEYATKCLRKIHTLGKDTDLPSFKDLEGLAKAIAEETEGFSYAYMKELFLGFLLHFAHSGGENINDPKLLLLNHISNLKKQIEITIEEKEEEEEKEKEKEKVSDAGAPRRASSLIRCLRRLFL
ncbi:P-loop containing nucleoside triphosphate hydrolase protein [Mycena albidolilacea]|uniref:P-loop containing nucleoside triphosphate hydrolase protein n=1 Tax=Mycena albidolilacea TaxID=1033008 RepID=A0AAD7ASB5_9AGAR|nr:P-loop containing nucleoside triphosphate hydrolase protein [Mycena albidolilacea]